MATPPSTTQFKVIASAEVHRSTHKKSIIIVSAQSLWGVDMKWDIYQYPWTLDRYIWFLECMQQHCIKSMSTFFFFWGLQWHRNNWVTLKTSNQTVLVFIKQPILSLNTKCPHLSTTYCIIVTLVSMHSLLFYAVKNNLTVTYFHT